MPLFYLLSEFVCDVVAVLYPAYASFKAIKSRNVKDIVPWLMYWIVLSVLGVIEFVADIFISWFPFYYLLKTLLVLWLISPQTKGYLTLYSSLVHPTLERHEKTIDTYLTDAQTIAMEHSAQLGKRSMSWLQQYASEGLTRSKGYLTEQILAGALTATNGRQRSNTYPPRSSPGGSNNDISPGGSPDGVKVVMKQEKSGTERTSNSATGGAFKGLMQRNKQKSTAVKTMKSQARSRKSLDRETDDEALQQELMKNINGLDSYLS